MSQEVQENRLKRLIFRSHHRGTKESDLILGQFAVNHLAGMSTAEIDLYERFLDEDDAEIWDWVVGKSAALPEYAALITHLRAYTPPK